VKAGQPSELLGNLQVPIDDVVIEATKFTATCYGVNVKAGDMSDVRVEVWSRKIGKKNITSALELKSFSPTSQPFRENVKRAHMSKQPFGSFVSSQIRHLLMPPSTFGFVMRRVKSLFP